MTNSKVDPRLIHLNYIRILKAYLNVSDDFLNDPKEIQGFNLGTKSESGFNIDEKLLRFRIFIRLTGIDKDQNNIGVEGEYVIEYLYEIENMEDFISYSDKPKKKEEFNVATDIGATIAGISYSTARGIVLDRTLGTDFNGVLLPVINPSELLEVDTYTQEDKTP